MTEIERQQRHFNRTVGKCKHGQQPQLQHEPGVHCIGCDREKCPCTLIDGDHHSATPIILEWERLRR